MFSAGDYEPPAFYLSPHLNVKLGIGTRAAAQMQRFAVQYIKNRALIPFVFFVISDLLRSGVLRH